MNEQLCETKTTQIELPAISLGTTVLGGIFEPVSSIVAQQVLGAAYRRRACYLDTAPEYGLSLSERRPTILTYVHPDQQ